MAEDLWEYDEPNKADAEESEDWSEGSDSPKASRPCKSRKRGRPAARQAADIVSDEGEQQHQQESLDDAEDDPFSSVHKQQQQAKRQKCNGVSSPLSVASDEDTPVAAAAEEQRAGQAGTTLEHAAVLSSRAQELADRQRLIQAKLEQAKQLGKQEEEEEPEFIMPSPVSTAKHYNSQQHQEPDDPVLLGSDDASPDISPAKAAAPGNADEGKLALKFKMQGRDDVLVRLHPSEPLQAAMDRFLQYVSDQGWGVVVKFVSPDGDKLTGQETAEQLGLEEGDVIEVHLK